ncbi:BTAD domain-containing putative transcriptional regulator [Mycobacterium sp. 852002-10029_SCH5224772]|uniref:BTAD domain-containing putative transcriptional regulator n=1 Tax=Mycobacterium sp. 852002-10029_SCH5224772 TaxID=1834083 RepID=UPI0009ED27DD|nr:BTAD domain-containing putative transcriptional regulator [Mycobacterium sp. 852002-10029_SCH5224772]
MELGVLGPLQVRRDGAPVAIPGAKPRALLTMLGLHDGAVVSADMLVELLWGYDPPRTAAKALQTHVSSLRRALGDGFILTQGAGWVLADSEVDASRYKSAARLGRAAAAAGDTSQAVARFEEALALWRGIPDLPDGRRGTSEKTRWIEGHAALVEDRADALLATGRAAEVIGDLEAAVADAPLRERRWGQLMLALYRAGRQGEALGAYQRVRALLADELGVDPGPELRRLEAAIVTQDSLLDIAVARHVPSVTRAVTFLLTDIEGSTSAWEVDADAMAVALARHDELIEQVVTSRGGRLIKTRGEGDATFSVFERPSAAASAAVELQDAIAHEPWALREPMRIRVALHTGEVELRDGDYFGRAVNRVARLRSLAEGGQILCSGATAELVIDSLADDVVLTDLGMRQLRNLARPEHVFELRLETGEQRAEPPTTETPMQRPGLPAVLVGPGPFVGRGRELNGLLSAWQSALTGGVRTVLIAGEPGVGKTRLAGEWSQRAYDQGAVVLYGRCDEDLGAPYQPFAEALRSLVPCMGANRLRGLRGVEALLSLVPGLTDVVPDLAPPTHADPDTERYALFDAVVALLEIASASTPVLLILDDLHWAAKPTLLLLRHLLRFGDHARVQIVGTYRSTDLDRSHPLAAMLADLHRDGTANRLSLGGLDEDDVTTYVAEAGYDDEELARALASVTGGNPFFLIEALRHVGESGGVWDQSTLPQGVREAVSRRLSRLPVETNKALATAAVVGSRFAVELVERVTGDDLVDAFDEARRAGIVIEEPGGNYRFNHAIVRQSLLAELASVRRMRLHQSIATTLETMPGSDDELLAELAHHYFECAWAGNAAKAVFYCRHAADQAMARLAYEGAADLYHRALHALEELDEELPDRDDQTAELLVARCEALLAAGDVASAAGAVAQLQAATVDSARLAAWATCFEGQLSMLIHPERLDEVEAALGAAAAKLAELDDDAGEAKAHTVRAGCLARLGRIADCEIALDDALTAARRAREHRRVNAVLAGAPLAALWGPNPVPRAGGRCLDVVRLLRITTDSPAVEAISTRCQAVLEAFRGRAAAARRMIDSARRTVTELGLRHALLEVEQFAGIVELVVDDPAAAEPHLHKAYHGFRRMGLDADTAETAALLGRAYLALDRESEADELCSESERLAGHALKASIAWRTLRAHLLARRGDHDAARQVAEAAVTLAERTDALVDHGDACLTLATVLAGAGDAVAARSAAEQAVELYERKGAVTLAEMARDILGEQMKPSAPARPEAPSVELGNACVRAGERVTSAINHEAWDEFEKLFAPDGFIESRRKVVGFGQIDVPSGEFPQLNRRVLEKVPMRVNQTAIAVRGERLALARLVIGAVDVSPGAPHDEFLLLYGIDDDGQISLQVWFDVEDLDAAMAELDAIHAKFEAAHPHSRTLDNAATRAFERFWSYFAARDWDAVGAIVSESLSGADHRRVVNAGDRGSRESVIQDLQVAADLGFTIGMADVMAIRGEHLALTRVRASGSDPETIQNDAFNLIEIAADERITSIAIFDLDDSDAAFAELDDRYLAGEAAAHAHTWSVIAGTYASVSRHEFPAITPDCITVDHRRTTAFGPGETSTFIRAGWDLGQDIRPFVETVHRLSDLGAVCSYAGHGVSREGFVAEWRGVGLSTVEGDMINRAEFFDEADLDAAITRFDQLSRPAPRLENTACRAFDRYMAHFAARDWDALTKVMADDIVTDDRRRVVNAGIRRGRDAEITNLRAGVDAGGGYITAVIIATRGERLALVRISGHYRENQEFVTDLLGVVEVNSDNQIAVIVVIDLDDFDSAITELDARYLAGEADPYSQTWAAVAETYAAVNRQQLPLSPGCVSIDHRQARAFPPGEVTAYMHATWEIAPNATGYLESVHRLSDCGAVLTHVVRGSSQEGFDAEWREVILGTFDGGVISRCELFDEADLDAAIARFEQLSPRPSRLKNRATLVFEHVWSHFAVRDWDAMAKTVADNYVSIDHRRVVSAEPQHSRNDVIRDLKAAAEVGFMISMVSAVAIRGERLVLARVRASGSDPDAAQNDALNIVEIDADDRIANVVVYDLEDFDAAITELDARYLAGEAADHAQVWSAIARGYVAVNRCELPAITPDSVYIDHRAVLTTAREDLAGYLPTVWDLMPDVSAYIEAVHRLSEAGAVIAHAARGTSQDGFDAEWRAVVVGITDGDLYRRVEVFDETDLDAALDRFDELSRPAPRLENAASKVAEQFLGHYAVRDWDAMAELLADDVSSDDRRSVINAGIRRGRDAEMANWRATGEVWSTHEASIVAVRGERLALCRTAFTSQGRSPEAFSASAFGVVEVNDDNRIRGIVVIEPEDIDAAFEELDARYLAGEAAAHAHTWSVIARVYGSFNQHDIPEADWVTVDHRRTTPFASGNITPSIRAVWDLTPNFSANIETVHRLNDFGAVVTHTSYGTSPQGFDAEWRMIQVLTVEGDRINRCELFDEADLDAALARLDNLRSQQGRLENAASRVDQRLHACFAARDWNAMTEALAEDTLYDDRRRVANAGLRRGRDAELVNIRALVDLGASVMSTVIATRGERLVLTQARFSGPDQRSDAFHNVMVSVLEIDAEERIVARIVFDLEDINAAFAELDARYLAGEAAPHAHTWSVASGANAQFNRHEFPATTANPVYIDHRRLVSIAGVDLATSVGAMWDLTSDTSAYIESVHRLSELGTVTTQVLKMTSQEGFDAELRLTYVIAVEGNLLSRIEVFDEADLDDALATFEQLSQPTRRLENAASRAERRLFDRSGTRDWAAIVDILAPDSYVDDRRRVVNVGFWDGRDAVVANMRALAEGLAQVSLTAIAIRGERLALARIRSFNPDSRHGEFSIEMLGIVEIDTDGRIAAHIFFDAEDIDAAFEELDARYLAGEAAAHPHTWSAVLRALDAFNRREIPATTPDWANIDHRRGRAFSPGDLVPYIRAAWELAPKAKIYVEAVHRLSSLGAVVTEVLRGTSPNGFDAEWLEVNLITVEGDLINRSELFDEEDLDAAVTRFDELQPLARRLQNKATRAEDRFFAYYKARDWAALAEMLTDGSFIENRVPVVNTGLWQDREVVIANMQALAEAVANTTSTVVAIRGERLALTLMRYPNSDSRYGQFAPEQLIIAEVDTDDRIAAHIVFDPEDIDAAFEELENRYLAGEAAIHSRVWSVIARAQAGFTRRELPATTPNPVYIDHRSLLASDAVDLAAALQASWDVLAPDINVYVETVHRLSELGAVVMQALKGSSREGFAAEWRLTNIFTVEGDLINRCEVFDEEDLDVALARFDQLAGEDKPK